MRLTCANIGKPRRSRVEPFAIEAFAKRSNMVSVAGFYDAMNSDRGKVVIGECAIVSDVDDTGAFFGD